MKSIIIIFILLIAVFMTTCKSPESGRNAPDDHTINKGGFFHKPGLDNPVVNCVLCHGDDLRGGTSGVSCFSCHGEIW
jgi:hypothetical protein